jgi:Zn-dependent oligopeptidase
MKILGKISLNRFFQWRTKYFQKENINKIEIRPYLKLTEVLTGNIIAQIKKLFSNKIDEKQVKVQSVKPTKDWKISTEKIDIAKIEDLNRKIRFIF